MRYRDRVGKTTRYAVLLRGRRQAWGLPSVDAARRWLSRLQRDAQAQEQIAAERNPPPWWHD